MEQISIGLDKWIIEVIEKKAKEENKTISEVAREILVKHLLEFKNEKNM